MRPPPPTVTRDEVDLMIRRAGLTLNAGQKADLAVSFQHLVTLAARLPRERPLTDEPAFTFHPPLPAAPEPAKAEKPAKAPSRKPAPRPARAVAKPSRPKPKATAAKTAAPKAKPKPKARPKPARAAARPARRR